MGSSAVAAGSRVRRVARLRIIPLIVACLMTRVLSAPGVQKDNPFGMGPPTTPPIVDAAAATAPVIPGPCQPTWESLRSNYRVPQWYIDAKFGITLHWGLYSVPAYHNEWYEKHMYAAFADWHAQHFGPQDQFGYKDFIPLFKAEKFDPDSWAQLFKKSGARYVMPTAEHHDWFSMWDSDVSPWNAAKMGPKRDIIGELAKAVRKQGMKFGVCNHSIEHYTFIQPKAGLKTDLDDPKYADFYWTHHTDANLQKFLELWIAKNVELIDKYQPDLIWFDNGINARAYDPLKLKVAAYYYNRARQWGKEVSLDTKSTAYLAGSILDFEKATRGPKKTLPGVWEVEDVIGSTWGYTATETFRTPQSLITQLCETASRNGNFLLNLSPQADGTINQAQQDDLLQIGQWLQVNGEAIYGTHNWTTASEGAPSPRNSAAAPPCYLFTVKDDTLYAIAQSWPGDSALIRSLATGKVEGKIAGVSLLAGQAPLEFMQDPDGLRIKLPSSPIGKYAYVFKITGLKLNPPGPPLPALAAGVTTTAPPPEVEGK